MTRELPRRRPNPRPPNPDLPQLDLMRLDLFLKWSRVILRRTLAKAMCDADRVRINGHAARAAHEVRVGDTIDVELPRRRVRFRVRSIPSHAPGKEGGHEMLELLEDRRNNSDST